MATREITPEQILMQRELRKQSGMAGCVTGRPAPSMDFFGYRDVQIWNTDAHGRLNGDPGFDRKNPRCFCFDCRGAFDPQAEVDTELVNSGHERACEVYASLLVKPPPVPLPARTMTEHPEAYARGVPRSLWFPSSPSTPLAAPPPLEIPPLRATLMSLPAPRHRDILNESPEVRIKKDILQMVMKYRSDLIDVMDSRRTAPHHDEPEAREEYLAAVRKKEDDIWDKIRACELLITDLDE
jgi:hypothetical protein